VGVIPEPGESGADELALLDVREVAALLGVGAEHVRVAVRAGRLAGYRIGAGPKARIRIPSSAVANYLRDARAARIETR
jgi:excisionase family DNA binding protein